MEKREITPQQAVEVICYHALSKSGLTTQAYDEIQSLRFALMQCLNDAMKPKAQPQNVVPLATETV